MERMTVIDMRNALDKMPDNMPLLVGDAVKRVTFEIIGIEEGMVADSVNDHGDGFMSKPTSEPVSSLIISIQI